jgi:hypothetical protein
MARRPTCTFWPKKDIAPHIPVIDKSRRDDGTFSREDFIYDEARDCCICLNGQNLAALEWGTRVTRRRHDLLFRARRQLSCLSAQIHMLLEITEPEDHAAHP